MTPVVKRLLIANVAVFVVFALIVNGSQGLNAFTKHLALSPADWFRLPLILPFWQLLTYGFLHADVGHIFYNMLGLYFFGTMLEEIIGSRRFLSVYATALVLGAAVHLTIALVGGSTVPTIGASGGVFCVVAATAVMRPTAPVILFFVPMTLRTMALIFVGLDVFQLLLSLQSGGDDGVARWIHLTGAVWGFTAARKGLVWKDPIETLQASREAYVQREQERDEERLDRLLKQISESGIHSLSRRDRDFLKRVSSRR
jgi:membrane associated rhomboid family serine protease